MSRALSKRAGGSGLVAALAAHYAPEAPQPSEDSSGHVRIVGRPASAGARPRALRGLFQAPRSNAFAGDDDASSSSAGAQAAAGHALQPGNRAAARAALLPSQLPLARGPPSRPGAPFRPPASTAPPRSRAPLAALTAEAAGVRASKPSDSGDAPGPAAPSQPRPPSAAPSVSRLFLFSPIPDAQAAAPEVAAEAVAAPAKRRKKAKAPPPRAAADWWETPARRVRRPAGNWWEGGTFTWEAK